MFTRIRYIHFMKLIKVDIRFYDRMKHWSPEATQPH